jgi:transposase
MAQLCVFAYGLVISTKGHAMFHVGIDVHKSSSTFCILDSEQPKATRYRFEEGATEPDTFRRVLSPLQGQCEVTFEIGPMAQWVRSQVAPYTSQVHVANASRMPWLFRSGQKTDRLDARKLAIVSHLDEVPEVPLPSLEVSQWRKLIAVRRSEVVNRGRCKNDIRAMLYMLVARCPHRSLWTRVGRRWLRELPVDQAYRICLDLKLAELEQIETRIRVLERELDRIASKHPAVALLRTIPGIGPRTAEAIVAYTDEISRFPDRKCYASYFGMTPKEDSSGQRVRRGRISKQGPSVVRWVLIEAAQQAIRRCPAFQAYAQRISKGRKDRRKKAIVATGRKLLAIGFGMWKNGEVFDVERLTNSAA